MTNIRGVVIAAIALVLLVVLVALARTNRDWAVVAKVAAGILVFAALLAVFYVAYDRYWDRPHVVQSLHGVSLGMPRQALADRLGDPAVERGRTLYYRQGSRQIMVQLEPMNGKNAVVSTVCSNTGPVATGTPPRSHRSTVIDRLGEPEVGAGAGYQKHEWLLFTEWQFAVRLYREQVVLVCGTTETSLDFKDEAEAMDMVLEEGGSDRRRY